jgi:hypothetical protein
MKRKTKAIAGTAATATSGAQAQAEQRGQEAEREDDEQAGPARGPAQRHAAQNGVDRVGLDLGARHELVARRRRVDVLQRRRRRPTTTTRPRTRAGSTLPASRSENETVSIVPGGPWKSIQAPSFSNDEALDRVARAPGHDRGQRRQAAVLVLDPLQHAAAALREVARRGLGADLVQELVAPKHVAASSLVRLRRGEHDVVGLSTAVMSALSSRAVVCSVNWTS